MRLNLLNAVVIVGLSSSLANANQVRCEAVWSSVAKLTQPVSPAQSSDPAAVQNPVPKAIVTETTVDPNNPAVVTLTDLMQNPPSPGKLANFKVFWASLFHTIENMYGGFPMKVKALGLNWPKMMSDVLKNTANLEDTNAQHYAIPNFISQFNDAHISSTNTSTLQSHSPVKAYLAGDAYIVDTVEGWYPASVRQPQPGDEIVAVNGMKTDDFRRQFPTMTAVANDVSSKSVFAVTMGNWKEASGIPLSAMRWQELVYTFKDGTTGEVYTSRVPLLYTGIGLVDMPLKAVNSAPTLVQTPAVKTPTSAHFQAVAPHANSAYQKFRKMFTARVDLSVSKKNQDIPEILKNLADDQPAVKGSPIGIGDPKPFFKLPDDFKSINLPDAVTTNPSLARLFNDGFLTAGTYKDENGKTAGFLRIPSYEPDSIDTMVVTLRYYIAELSKNSDYLVIDQLNNPGGDVVFSDMVVRALIGKFDPAKHLRFAVRPTQGFLRQYLELRNDIASNGDGLFTSAEVAAYTARFDAEYKKVYAAFAAKHELSEPIALSLMSEYMMDVWDRSMAKGALKVGDSAIPTADLLKIFGAEVKTPQQYKNKIYMMVNRLCFSAGDATPTSLSAYGVTLLGERTAGAGGTVEEFSFRGAIEVIVRLTTSLMVKFDNTLVENYGQNITPGMDVSLNATDVKDGYAGYFGRFAKKISDDFKANPKRNY